MTDESVMPVGTKLCGYDFWRETLKGAKKIVAPMVDQSELAWRLLSRRHGAELCYTPMLNAKIMLGHKGYQKREFQTCPEDHPLIAQFCGDNPEVLLQAARMVEDQVEGVDLNLGCPQNIAKKGHYGSYLQDEWDLIRDAISTLHRGLKVPITAKIRVFDDVQKTIAYAKMIEDAGAQIITVHGRTREQRGENTGVADWQKIRMVKEAVSVPVFANGNILFSDDYDRCLEETGADGVMIAEGNLYNPAIFEDKYPRVWDMVDEYLNICRNEAPAPLTAVRGHLFKMYRPSLGTFIEHRTKLGVARSFDEISAVAESMNNVLKIKHDSAPCEQQLPPLNHSTTGSASAEWFCRSYIRDKELFLRTYSCKDAAESDEPDSRPLKIIKVASPS
ncbi:hypothetical protein PSACC_02887 [Paramicrosporidium saccamoebae]|uniref:tRNA-dihydrouridine(16/17) synthase [NAD(P)(+)] n=1 Tax=Paramicrosporidium saccamoebae TaxID=1246581 RepID=A0A2H9THS6_9FUNG|nr:hypothetical protein PSACC_02887 [Paramicrosporidium saccamoebae]